MKSTRCTCSTPGYPCPIHNMVMLRSADGTTSKVYSMRKLKRRDSDFGQDSHTSVSSGEESFHRTQSNPYEFTRQSAGGNEARRTASSGSCRIVRKEISSKLKMPRAGSCQVQYNNPEELEITWNSKSPNCSAPSSSFRVQLPFPRSEPSSSQCSRQPSYPCQQCQDNFKKMACKAAPSLPRECSEQRCQPKNRKQGRKPDSRASVRSCRLDVFNDGSKCVESRTEETMVYPPECDEPPQEAYPAMNQVPLYCVPYDQLYVPPAYEPQVYQPQVPENFMDNDVHPLRRVPSNKPIYEHCETGGFVCCQCKKKAADAKALSIKKEKEVDDKASDEKAKDTCKAEEDLNAVLQRTIAGLHEAVDALKKAGEINRKIELPADADELNRALNTKLKSNIAYVQELKGKMQKLLKELQTILANEPNQSAQLTNLLKQLEGKANNDGNSLVLVSKDPEMVDLTKVKTEPGVKAEPGIKSEPGVKTEPGSEGGNEKGAVKSEAPDEIKKEIKDDPDGPDKSEKHTVKGQANEFRTNAGASDISKGNREGSQGPMSGGKKDTSRALTGVAASTTATVSATSTEPRAQAGTALTPRLSTITESNATKSPGATTAAVGATSSGAGGENKDQLRGTSIDIASEKEMRESATAGALAAINAGKLTNPMQHGASTAGSLSEGLINTFMDQKDIESLAPSQRRLLAEELEKEHAQGEKREEGGGLPVTPKLVIDASEARKDNIKEANLVDSSFRNVNTPSGKLKDALLTPKRGSNSINGQVFGTMASNDLNPNERAIEDKIVSPADVLPPDIEPYVDSSANMFDAESTEEFGGKMTDIAAKSNNLAAVEAFLTIKENIEQTRKNGARESDHSLAQSITSISTANKTAVLESVHSSLIQETTYVISKDVTKGSTIAIVKISSVMLEQSSIQDKPRSDSEEPIRGTDTVIVADSTVKTEVTLVGKETEDDFVGSVNKSLKQSVESVSELNRKERIETIHERSFQENPRFDIEETVGRTDTAIAAVATVEADVALVGEKSQDHFVESVGKSMKQSVASISASNWKEGIVTTDEPPPFQENPIFRAEESIRRTDTMIAVTSIVKADVALVGKETENHFVEPVNKSLNRSVESVSTSNRKEILETKDKGFDPEEPSIRGTNAIIADTSIVKANSAVVEKKTPNGFVESLNTPLIQSIASVSVPNRKEMLGGVTDEEIGHSIANTHMENADKIATNSIADVSLAKSSAATFLTFIEGNATNGKPITEPVSRGKSDTLVVQNIATTDATIRPYNEGMEPSIQHWTQSASNGAAIESIMKIHREVSITIVNKEFQEVTTHSLQQSILNVSKALLVDKTPGIDADHIVSNLYTESSGDILADRISAEKSILPITESIQLVPNEVSTLLFVETSGRATAGSVVESIRNVAPEYASSINDSKEAGVAVSKSEFEATTLQQQRSTLIHEQTDKNADGGVSYPAVEIQFVAPIVERTEKLAALSSSRSASEAVFTQEGVTTKQVSSGASIEFVGEITTVVPVSETAKIEAQGEINLPDKEMVEETQGVAQPMQVAVGIEPNRATAHCKEENKTVASTSTQPSASTIDVVPESKKTHTCRKDGPCHCRNKC